MVFLIERIVRGAWSGIKAFGKELLLNYFKPPPQPDERGARGVRRKKRFKVQRPVRLRKPWKVSKDEYEYIIP